MASGLTLLAFAGVSVLLAMTPGPDMAVVTRNALAHGRRGVIFTTTGIALALSIWITATALGVSALLQSSATLLFALKLVGAAYLAYLGVRTLIDSRKRPGELLAGAPPAAPGRAIFRQGFLSALSNPKASSSSHSCRSGSCQVSRCCRRCSSSGWCSQSSAGRG